MAKLNKVYYSISEVSDLTGLEQHVLRYWESEFSSLKPLKNRGGNRAYREKDIRLVFLIKKLLYHDRFTIEGARRQLHKASESYLEQLELSFDEIKTMDLIRSVREELREILDLVDDMPGDLVSSPSRKRKGAEGRAKKSAQ